MHEMLVIAGGIIIGGGILGSITIGWRILLISDSALPLGLLFVGAGVAAAIWIVFFESGVISLPSFR